MDPQLRERIYALLAGREDKKPKTLSSMMARFDLMAELGFRFDEFAKGPDQAQAEGDRFFLVLRQRKERQIADSLASGRPMHARRKGEGRSNYRKNLRALCRLYRFPYGAEDGKVFWRITKQFPAQKDVYTGPELAALLRLPFRNTERNRCMRALMTAHMALGWRLGELVLLEDRDVNAVDKTVFLRNPEKGNPQRWIPIEEPFFSENRAMMSWMRHRPVYQANPRLVWTFTDERKHVVKAMTEQKLGLFLTLVGRLCKVRVNCTRGRHTRIAAWFAQGRNIVFVRDGAGHHKFDSLPAYVEMVEAGLLKHLAKPTWFVSAQGLEG